MPVAESEISRKPLDYKGPPDSVLISPHKKEQENISPQTKVASKLEAIFTSEIVYQKPALRINQESSRSWEEAKKKYLITGNLTYEEERKLGLRTVSGYQAITQKGEEWFLEIFPERTYKLPEQISPFTLNGAGEELANRQDVSSLTLEHEQAHEESVQFFAVNWNKIAQIFYQPEIPKEMNLKGFVEVNFNDLLLVGVDRETPPTCSVADFIGELPDGQLIINEFHGPSVNRNEKISQLAKQTRGLYEVITKHNTFPSLPRVSQFLSVYTKIDDVHILRILPRSNLFTEYLSLNTNETTLFEHGVLGD